MYIESIYIDSFGAIKNKRLELSDSMNLLEGANESGKSTIASFIRFMFYGFPTKKDRERSCPFDSDRCGGTLTLENGGKRYRIERMLVGIKDDVSVISLDRNEVCYEGKAPGEFFFGFSSQIYTQTSYIPQLGSSVDGISMSDAIDNMIFSADEKISVQKAIKRLDDVRVMLLHKNGRGGRISELEAEKEELLRTLEAARAQNEERLLQSGTHRRLSDKLSEVEAKTAELKLQIERYSADVRRSHSEQTAAQREQLARLDARLAMLREKFSYNGFLPDAEYVMQLRSVEERSAQIEEQLNELARRRETAAPAPGETADAVAVPSDPALEGDLAAAGTYSDIARPADIAERIEKLGGEAGIYRRIEKLHVQRRVGTVFGVIFLLLFIPTLFLSAVMIFMQNYIAMSAAMAGELLMLIGMITSFASRSKKSAAEDSIYITLQVEDEADLERLFRDVAVLPKTKPKASPGAKPMGDGKPAGEPTPEESVIIDQRESLRREQAELCARWGHSDPAAARRDAETYLSYNERIVKAMDKCRAAYDAAPRAEALATAKAAPTSELPVLPEDFDIAAAQRRLEKYTAEADELRLGIHKVEVRLAELSSVASSAETADRINRINDEIAKRKHQLLCCRLARECLAGAGEELRDTVAPRISDYVGKLMNIMSNGRYNTLGVDSALSLSYNAGKNGMHITKGVDYMSAGTQDIAYISLRLSLLQILCRDSMPPLVFDESFSRLDDKRLSQTLKLLAVMAKAGVQILIFTAQHRERELMGAIDYKHIIL